MGVRNPYLLEGDPVEQARIAIAQSPFNAWLKPDVVRIDIDAGVAEMALPFRPEFARLPGENGFHGGVLAAFMDLVGDFAVVAVARAAVPTINLRVDYLRPCDGGEVRAVAVARRVGRTFALVDVDLFDAAGKLSATARGSYAMPKRG